jgi:hypothetical protein
MKPSLAAYFLIWRGCGSMPPPSLAVAQTCGGADVTGMKLERALHRHLSCGPVAQTDARMAAHEDTIRRLTCQSFRGRERLLRSGTSLAVGNYVLRIPLRGLVLEGLLFHLAFSRVGSGLLLLQPLLHVGLAIRAWRRGA